MKIRINKEYEQYRQFIEETPQKFELEGKTIYKSRNEIKCFEVGDITLNVKSYKIPIFINRIIYTWFRKSKARRAFEYALKLMEKGIKTPTPIAYIEMKKGGLLHRSYFISIHEPLDGCMRIFNDFDENNEGKIEIIKEFARFTAKLHESEVLHYDYSPGNILYGKIAEEGENQYTFSLIDINRMQFRPVSVEMAGENFSRMRGNEEFFRLFATEYALARKSNVELCVANFLEWKEKDRIVRAKRDRFKKFRKRLFS